MREIHKYKIYGGCLNVNGTINTNLDITPCTNSSYYNSGTAIDPNEYVQYGSDSYIEMSGEPDVSKMGRIDFSYLTSLITIFNVLVKKGLVSRDDILDAEQDALKHVNRIYKKDFTDELSRVPHEAKLGMPISLSNFEKFDIKKDEEFTIEREITDKILEGNEEDTVPKPIDRSKSEDGPF